MVKYFRRKVVKVIGFCTYVKFVSNIGIAGNYTGTGSINGNELTESGQITTDGAPYEGNLGEWFRNLSKQ